MGQALFPNQIAEMDGLSFVYDGFKHSPTKSPINMYVQKISASAVACTMGSQQRWVCCPKPCAKRSWTQPSWLPTQNMGDMNLTGPHTA